MKKLNSMHIYVDCYHTLKTDWQHYRKYLLPDILLWRIKLFYLRFYKVKYQFYLNFTLLFLLLKL